MICYECGFEISTNENKNDSDCPSCGGLDFYEKGEEYVSYY